MPFKCSLNHWTEKICSSLNSSLNAFRTSTPPIPEPLAVVEEGPGTGLLLPGVAADPEAEADSGPWNALLGNGNAGNISRRKKTVRP